MLYQFHSCSDRGQLRANNEDSVLFDAESGLALLADGMGGHNAGEIASAIAIAVVHRAWRNRWQHVVHNHAPQRRGGAHGGAADAPTPADEDTAAPPATAVREALDQCIAAANAAIFEESERQPAFYGMGTTLVACVFSADRLVVGHVGDSRCYLLREGRLQALTQDHTVAQRLLASGEPLPDDELAATRMRHSLTRALGVEPAIEADFSAHRLQPGDAVLLCSDGLTDMLDDRAIERTLQQAQPAEARARALVQAANAAGGHDNVSVVLVEAERKPRQRGRVARMLRLT